MSELDVAWPRCRPVDHQGAQPFGGGVDRGRQPGGTGTDHDQVELPDRRGDRTAEAMAISRLLGFSSTAPLGNTMSGSSRPSPAAATISRPLESARQKWCGTAHAWSASRIS